MAGLILPEEKNYSRLKYDYLTSAYNEYELKPDSQQCPHFTNLETGSETFQASITFFDK